MIGARLDVVGVECFAVTMMHEYGMVDCVGIGWADIEQPGLTYFFEDGVGGIIILSLPWFRSIDNKDEMLDVVAHEFAHLISGEKEHSARWAAACEITGADPVDFMWCPAPKETLS